MKKLIIILASAFFLLTVSICFADQWVNGYYRKNGTYVQGHWRSSPDSNTWNNYSTKGNINPYTLKRGHTNPYKIYNPYKSYNLYKSYSDN